MLSFTGILYNFASKLTGQAPHLSEGVRHIYSKKHESTKVWRNICRFREKHFMHKKDC